MPNAVWFISYQLKNGGTDPVAAKFYSFTNFNSMQMRAYSIAKRD